MSGSPTGRRDHRRQVLLPEPPPLDEDQTAWLLTLSDLVLQLFAFVMVAVVLGNARQTPRRAAEPKPAAEWPIVPSPPPTTSLPHRVQTVGEHIEDALHADGVSVTVRESDVVVSVSDRISFPSGSTDLLPTALPLLGRIGTLAAALPDCTIEVAGHTDDVPIHTGAFPSNLELSLARAARVVRELAIASPGLEGRMIATGFGEHRPLVPNADAEGRAQNRRVEIRFIPR